MALVTVAVVGMLITLVGVGVSLGAVGQAQLALTGRQANTELDLVEGCVEEGLWYLHENGELPSTVVLPEITCSVSDVTEAGGVWSGMFRAVEGEFGVGVWVEAELGSSVEVLSWREV